MNIHHTRSEGLPAEPLFDRAVPLGWEDYSPKAIGPKYPPHEMSSPLLEAKDVLGLVAAAVITLGPLAAYAFGFGL